jgi:hypothetical protein
VARVPSVVAGGHARATHSAVLPRDFPPEIARYFRAAAGTTVASS